MKGFNLKKSSLNPIKKNKKEDIIITCWFKIIKNIKILKPNKQNKMDIKYPMRIPKLPIRN